MDSSKSYKSFVNLVQNAAKKKKRKRKRDIDLTDTEGLRKLSLDSSVLEDIGVVIGETITIAKPWCYVKKNMLIDRLNLDSSEIAPFKDELLAFSRDEMLLIHIIDEEKEVEDYYVCTSESSADLLNNKLQKQQEEQHTRLTNTIFKTARPWMSLGSEKEVDESIISRRRCRREIVIQSSYPISKTNVKFRARNADENTSFGYMELTSEEGQLSTLIRKRQDASVQATKDIANGDAQTKLVYPKNAAVRYHYEVDEHQEIPENFTEKVDAITETDIFSLHDALNINHHINLYANDYKLLCQKKIHIRLRKEMRDAKECISCLDVETCKDKMISSVAWHSVQKDIVAISYCDIKSLLYTNQTLQSDETDKAMHDVNPVYLWTTSDPIYPKIVLESQREVETLSFCPFDHNILIGGCINGQVILWDLSETFKCITNEPKLSTTQLTSRESMYSLMGWMKKTMTPAHKAPTALSDLSHSHTSPIVKIEWIPRSKEVTDCGKMLVYNNPKENILQFATASLDGTVRFWDLKRQGASLNRSRYRASSTKQKPKGLVRKESPLKSLDGNFKPVYTVHVRDVNTPGSVAISSFDVGSHDKVPEKTPGQKRLLDTVEEDKIKHEPEVLPDKEFCVTSIRGEHLRIRWGEEYVDSDEEETKPYANVVDYAQYHDGPITSLSRSDICDITLSTGGCIFAIWSSKIKHKPLIWRKRRDVLVSGTFNTHQPTIFYILTVRGFVEVWNISCESKKPVVIRRISDNALTQLLFQSNGSKSYMLGFADAYGCFRTFTEKNTRAHTEKDKIEFNNFVQREIERNRVYSMWYDNWRAKHVVQLDRTQEKTKFSRISGVKERIKIIEKMKSLHLKKPKSNIEKYMERAHLKEQHYIDGVVGEMIDAKKKADKDDLVEKKMPLQILKEETEKKKRKMRLVKRNAESLSAETIEVSFPEVVAKEPLPIHEPYADIYTQNEKYKCFQNYEKAVSRAVQVMEAKPFSYVFDVKETIRGYRRKERLTRSHGKIPLRRVRQVSHAEE